MDIRYLLALQNFREATQDFFSDFLIWISHFSVSFWPLAAVCMIYWVFDRKAGKRILVGTGLGLLANGFLKLTFRITRPWLRDPRITPYGDSMTTATGYSFPSGHTSFATAIYGGIAVWQRKRRKAVAILLLAALGLLMFSRNYLGVHTPQDVVVGFISTLAVMFFGAKIEDWTDERPRRDWIVMVFGLVTCAALVVYYHTIDIAEVYDAAGVLVVDPVKMKADSFEGIGFISAWVICRCFERRLFRFDTALSRKDRFILCTFALIPLHWWYTNIVSVCAPYSRALGQFAKHSGVVVYTTILVPFVLSKIRLPEWMKNEK